MKYLISSIALACTLTGPAAAAVVQPATDATLVGNNCSSVALAENAATVQVGAAIIANVDLTGGPAACATAVTADNSNTRATLETKDNVTFVRITALHDGFTNISVLGTNGTPIGAIKVSVYPRDPRGSM